MSKLSEFNVKDGNWQSYCDRLDMYFKVNSVKDDLKLPTLIAFMGEEAYELLVNLCSPRKPAEMTLEEVKQAMLNHLQPSPSFLAERYKFRQRRQCVGENMAVYVSELKKLSRYCEFGTSLDENLRDQFACGIMSDVIRQRLFAEGKITFVKAVSVANSMEAAERDSAAVSRHNGGEGASASRAAAAPGGRTGPEAAGRRSSAGMDLAGTLNKLHLQGGCLACGDYRHKKNDCRFKTYECSRCKKVGHLRRVCQQNIDAHEPRTRRGNYQGGQWGRGGVHGGNAGNRIERSRGGRSGSKVNRLETYREEADEGGATYSSEDDGNEEAIYQMSLNQYRPVSMTICVNNVNLSMEVDTGSPLSCISFDTYKLFFQHLPIQKCDLSVRFYNGSKVKPLGYLEVTVNYNKTCRKLDLYVFNDGVTSLLGRQWIAELNISIPSIPIQCNSLNNNCNLNEVKELNNVQKNVIVNDVVDRYKELFDGGLGCFNGGRATLRIREGAAPVFCRARPLPYALRARVDAELDAMLRAGVIEPVDCSDWATPLVIVHKPDGALRICADYKVTLNKVLKVDKYPVPKIDDLLTKLSGYNYFTKLDLSQAYNQVLLDDTSNLTVINTHRGLFKYNRLVYGLSSSPGIFQRIMSQLFAHMPNVTVFLDDILIGGTSISSNLETLNNVLRILQDHGLKLKKQKCDFFNKEVKYLGFIISNQGIKVDPDKIKPIVNLLPPRNVSELKSFLGMINFYGKFIKNLSFHLSPLYDLLRKGKHWHWEHIHDRCFKLVKRLLIGADVLVHYDESRELVLTCDASAHGLGAVLAQRGAGAERPVAYASRALTRAEINYSQIHKEALAIVFAVKKFHQFLYGRHFTLRTDHKPLVSIFGPDTGVPSMTASRLQRWALLLSAYDFSIEYVSTDNNTAGALSRMLESYKALNATTHESNEPEQTYLHFASEALLLKYEDIRDGTRKDPILGRVLSYVKDGWPNEVEIRELQPYYNRRDELYIELGCLMWGYRLVIPSTCRDDVLRELHDTHMGIVRTKSIARSYVWWPGVDEAVEALCRACAVCAEQAAAPAQHAPVPWPWPARPWTRLHVDFLGPICGEKYLVVIDACSKWIEICKMPTTTAKTVINKLREMWARFGIPKQLVSDNGPPFSSDEFNYFLTNNGVEHIFSAPYHPASNGLAENAVKICKKVIKKAVAQRADVDAALQRFLLIYRTTEHSTTKESPAQILQGRLLRTRLDRLKPPREELVAAAQRRQQRAAGGSWRGFQAGDSVWVRVYHPQSKWVSGLTIEKLGNTDYNVKLDDGTVVHRHADQMRLKCKVNTSQMTSTDPVNSTGTNEKEELSLRKPVFYPAACLTPSGGRVTSVGGEGSSRPTGPVPSECEVSGSEVTRSQDQTGAHTGPTHEPLPIANEPRYPIRTRRPPERYGYS
ncbi:uncharacterized protein K02A2.6-like isoform X2 [Ostrinia furnacalis]|uniref:uncharacterized protein K02A2.6-like isoform X1 n=1 Tax=Ostrinia furnacalis TaxID=93504 RepID=UPI0010394130|nr:uncharacterized protein K02A2.6-like isoform X1 [Ostrinia furnacalis]XP_028172426.1 uncharacterized protein K02A2.6-like isoform X2 [Ostrinia furnacalis]